ncbi:hypothetical protein RRG08_059739 [Elysia crispata]|uniref:Secreted protein n=1 Tax=Elysia crispata TaxID=231223 RepID=A0AAE0YN84_9GAST|nr:hypothetical protein RRG08_059739 [Elysia crispata]
MFPLVQFFELYITLFWCKFVQAHPANFALSIRVVEGTVGEGTEVKVAWACHKIHRTSRNNPTYKEPNKEREIEEDRELERWEGNITEWTGQMLSDNLRRTEGTEKWRELVVRYSDGPTVFRPRDTE